MRNRNFCRLRLLGLWASLLSAAAMADIPPLHLEERLSVSGLSSGAAMAVQIAVAHSSRVSGLGIVSGPPYLCAQGLVTKATDDCLILGRTRLRELFGGWLGFFLPSGERDIDVQDLIGDTQRMAHARRIDPVAGIARQRVWVYRGQDDAVVGAKASAAQKTYFAHFGARVRQAESLPTPHTLPTDDPAQGPCTTADKDYVSGCGFDAAGQMLRYLRDRPAAVPEAEAGSWHELEQADFVPPLPGANTAPARRAMLGLAARARVYVPQACVHGRCQVHVALHGCMQGSSDAAYEAFTLHGGYVRWAGALNLVLLFPRVVAIKPFERGVWDSVGNPMGCWDWWGYSTPTDLHAYATRDAPQIRTVLNMVERLGRR